MSYWLDRWLEENEVNSDEELEHLLNNRPAAARSLSRFAEWWETEDLGNEDQKIATHRILAGSSLDLSGHMTCNHVDCLKQEVDSLFGSAWHYFDEIVVTGFAARSVGGGETLEDYLDDMEAHIRVAHYLRINNVMRMLTFVPKAHSCVNHVPRHLEQAGIEAVLQQRQGFVEALSKKTLLMDQPKYLKKGKWGARIADPINGLSVGKVLRASRRAPMSELERAAADVLFHMHADAMAADYLAAREARAPLALTGSDHGGLRPASSASPSEGDVAYHLNLPVIREMPLREIWSVMHEHGDELSLFRAALQTAIRERLAANDNATAEAIAAQIADDVLVPSLDRISRKLDVAGQAMRRKTSVNAVVGGTLTTVGLLTGVPLIAAAGVAALALAAPQVHTYLDKKSEVQLDDLYFLWRLENDRVR